MKNQSIYNKIESTKRRSAWARGVKEYALEMIESADVPITKENVKAILLNGADNWEQYSYGGCALIYDADIAERLCSPSELKRVRWGDRNPNSRETWLDVQARALFQAYNFIKKNL